MQNAFKAEERREGWTPKTGEQVGGKKGLKADDC